jgi:hypothetical protein
LTIGGTPQPGILLNSFFQLGVGDLTLRPGCRDSYRPGKGNHDNGFESDHNFLPIEEQKRLRIRELRSPHRRFYRTWNAGVDLKSRQFYAECSNSNALIGRSFRSQRNLLTLIPHPCPHSNRGGRILVVSELPPRRTSKTSSLLAPGLPGTS